MKQRSLSSYHAVDATNYQSMKEALGDVKGVLCIVTLPDIPGINDDLRKVYRQRHSSCLELRF